MKWLPRPIIGISLDALEFWLQSKFERGEVFHLCDDRTPIDYGYIGMSLSRGGQIVRAYTGGKNVSRIHRIGLLRFYSRVTKDIGLINPDLIINQSMHPLVWMTAGIDGISNIDRLCKAWATNGEILPTQTPEGKVLSEILKESSEWITPVNPVSIQSIREVTEYIDWNLNKYGTDLNTLANKSGAKLKI